MSTVEDDENEIITQVVQSVNQRAAESVREIKRNYEITVQAAKLVDDLIKDNPGWSDRTIKVAKVILETHPRINEMAAAFDILIPYILGVAHDMEIEIDRRLPKEWQNDK